MRKQLRQLTSVAPVNLMSKLIVTIKRADGIETVRGTMAGQSTSFYLLKKESDHSGAAILEWFAKDGPRVKCELKEDNE